MNKRIILRNFGALAWLGIAVPLQANLPGADVLEHVFDHYRAGETDLKHAIDWPRPDPVIQLHLADAEWSRIFPSEPGLQLDLPNDDPSARSGGSAEAENTPVVPDERDRAVLSALFFHLLEDSDFNLTRVSKDRTTINVHHRTPEKTGFLRPSQIRSDVGERRLPGEAMMDLQERNAAPGTFNAVAASFADCDFGKGVIVADLTGTWERRGSLRRFKETYPTARAWLAPYLPGYSDDGSSAIVRASV